MKHRNRKLGLFAKVAMLFAGVGMSAAANAAPAPAGARIDNVATVCYTDPVEGKEICVDSNLVRATVLPVEGLDLVDPRNVAVGPGATALLNHRLTNTGNVATEYTLSVQNLGGDQCDLTDITVWQDVDSDGDPDTILIGPGAFPNGTPGTSAPLRLPMQEFVDLIITGSVVNGSVNEVCNLEITASSTSTDEDGAPNATDTNVDSVRVVDGPALRVRKTASATAPRPGDTVEYRITTDNQFGSAPAPLFQVIVDGQAKNCLIVRDEIPVNMTFVEITNFDNGIPLYHYITEADTHTYHTPTPDVEDRDEVDAVAICYETPLAVGQSYDMFFTVQLSALASGNITNIAIAYDEDDDGTESNPLVLDVPDQAPGIGNYENTNYDKLAPNVELGGPEGELFIELQAGACNTDAGVAETYTLQIDTSEFELQAAPGVPVTDTDNSIMVTETGANTGVFQVSNVPTADADITGITINNGTIELVEDTEINIQFLDACAGDPINYVVTVAPFGYLFDAITGDPIPGVEIRLIDNNTGLEVGDSSTTDLEGKYFLDIPVDGDYRIELTPPAGYTFPSTVNSGSLPNIDTGTAGGTPPDINGAGTTGGSYGDVFTIAAAGGAGTIRAVNFDIPLNQASINGLLVEKTVSRQDVEVGDIIRYTVTISNGTGTQLADTDVLDILPHGFIYVPGSSRLDGVSIPDPIFGQPNHMLYEDFNLPIDAEVELTYRVRVGPGALVGEGINSAQATHATPPATSNIASVAVVIRPSVFSDDGAIIGKVYLDCDYDRQQGHEELGVPGVRIYMEDGSYVITDVEGKYSFYGVKPGLHVLKLDRTTLPAGWEDKPLDNRHAGDGGSRFVDLKKGELHKADFAHGSCASGEIEVYLESQRAKMQNPVKSREYMDLVRSQVKWRRENGGVFTPEIEKGISRELSVEGFQEVRDPRREPSSGVKDTEAAPAYRDLKTLDRFLGKENSNLDDVVAPNAPSINLEELLKDESISDALGFVGLKDGDVVARTRINIVVKAKTGSLLALHLNGEKVPDTKQGEIASLPRRQMQAIRYVSVKLEPGENTLTAKLVDNFGNDRGTVQLNITAPGDIAKMKLVVPDEPKADGSTPVPVEVHILDDNDIAVTARTPITLESDKLIWTADDLDKNEPGVQVFVEGGRGVFHVLPPAETGDAKVRASSGVIRAEHVLEFVPDLRPMVAVGVIQGTLSLNSLGNNVVPAKKQDSFDAEIERWSTTEDDGKQRAAARAAFFLKGKVLGSYLLTAAFDSEKQNAQLARDIQPDEFYPVYGDSSVRGFDAQSTSRLYVKLEKNKSYLLWGDFTTASGATFLDVAAYNRALTGAVGHLEGQWGHATVWGSYDSTGQVVEEIRGVGTSGPYSTANSGINVVSNSEKVEIIVRDRNQPAIVLSKTELTRFADYAFNTFRGELFFKEPIASVDGELNPVFIRVSYEVEGGGEDYVVAGAEAVVKFSESVAAGVTYVQDEAPGAELQMAGAALSVQTTDNSELAVDFAATKTDDGITELEGTAVRAEWRYQGESFDLRAHYAEAEADFNNPNSSVSPGRKEGGLSGSWAITDDLRLRAEALDSEDTITGNKRTGYAGSLEYSFSDAFRAEIGGRYAEENNSPAASQAGVNASTGPIDVTSVFAKLTAKVPYIDGLQATLEYEQDTSDSSKRLIAVGADYYIADFGKLYARHEAESSLDGGFGLNETDRQNTTVVGVQLDILKDTQVFSEYRTRDALSAAETQAAIGLRNRIQLGERTTMNLAIEHVNDVSKTGSGDSYAVSVGAEYLGENWKVNGRVEVRETEDARSYLVSAGVGNKLDRDLTFLAKNTYDANENLDTGDLTQRNRLQVGLAYRDTDRNKLNALLKYEMDYESDESSDTSTMANILSAHVNYQMNESMVLSGRVGTKWVTDDDGFDKDDYQTHLIMSRLTWDMTERWNVGLIGSTLFSDDATYYGLGFEVGYLLHANLWLTAGYNFFGYEEEHLAGQEYTNEGAYININYKFDENVWSGGNPEVDNTVAPVGN